MKAILVVLAVVFFTGCVTTEIGGQPIIRYGERVQVINGLKNRVDITYQTRKIGSLGSGQEGIFQGLRQGEHLVARVYSEEGELLGIQEIRVRSRRNRRSQLWKITSFRRLR